MSNFEVKCPNLNFVFTRLSGTKAIKFLIKNSVKANDRSTNPGALEFSRSAYSLFK